MKKLYTVNAILLVFLFSGFTFSQNSGDGKLNKLSMSLWEVVNNYKSQPFAKSNAMQSPGVTESGEDIYSVIVSSDNVAELDALNININARLKEFVTARVTISDLLKMIELNSVKNIRPGETLYFTNDLASASIGADLAKSGYINNTVYNGEGVLTCIIDSGIDWEHPDFRELSDQTKSRILYIWDLSLTKTGAEQTPQDRDPVNYSGLNYGVEYTKADIDNELDGSPEGFVRENDTNGHGTHVAGTVAGNGAALSTIKYEGIAPKADIIYVKLPNSITSVSIINALSYARNIAAELGMPMVVNMSLGGQANAHDGTTDQDIAIDNFVGPGRIVVVAAGNDGDKPIHISGIIEAGTTENIQFNVGSYTPAGGSDNDAFGFDLWFDDNEEVNAVLTTPNSFTATQNADGQGNTETNDGSVFLYNFVNINNNNREVAFIVDDNNSAITPEQGTWTLIVSNPSTYDMVYHGWLFSNTTNTSLVGGNGLYTIGSPGSATSAVTVGSYVTRWFWEGADNNEYNYSGGIRSDNISIFSSIGPRRDGMLKPEITAPGQAIISCTSSDITAGASDIIVPGLYHKNQGTSMAAPVTTGSIALLLQQNPALTTAEVKMYLTENTTTDAYTGSVPNNIWGFGKLNIFASLVKLNNSGWSTSREVLTYDQENDLAVFFQNQTQKAAVRFTPTFDGKITGLFFHLYQDNNITNNLSAEIWSDNGSGLPGSKLGSTVLFPTAKALGHSWNYINMESSEVNVNNGIDYHAVLYWTSQTANTGILTDFSSSDGRSSVFAGSWIPIPDDFKIRPVNSVSDESLPVELISFTASVSGSSIKLLWNTATEINNYGFDIERKKENQDWEKIGFVKGNGTSASENKYEFNDNTFNNSGRILYRLKQIDNNGTFTYTEAAEVSLLPVEYALEQNYPNPFNPSTTINYSLPEESKVKISLFNILGEQVADIVNQVQSPGIQQAVFNASSLSSGVYYYKIEAESIIGKESFNAIKKMMVLK